MDKGGRKSINKTCPGCGVAKVYPERNKCCSPECARSYRLKQNGKTAAKCAEGFESTGETAVLTRISEARITTQRQLLDLCAVDEREWEVERWLCNKWDQAAMPRVTGESGRWTRKDARPIVTELFQVKVWLKRKTAIVSARAEIAAMRADAGIERTFPAIERGPAAGYMLEVAIPDLHVGKLAWGKETGWENYDSRIAQEVFRAALGALIQRTSAYAFDRVLLVVGNDLLHSDNKQGTTTGGTPQDTDARFQKSFVIARSLMVEAIERLRLIAPVHVPVVPGNHDTVSTWCLGDSLESWFRNCPDVTIDNAPTFRKYHQFGKVMLMFTHGNKGKLADYPLVMAAERPEMFGETTHREAHTGDKHHFKLEDYHGIRVRISPALCPPDAWHAESHYVGASRSAEAFVWHEAEGLVGTAIYTVGPPPGKRAA